MNRKLLLFIVLFVGLIWNRGFANHMMGGTLTYKDLGLKNGKRAYMVTMKLYKDTYNNPGQPYLPPSVPVGVYIQDASDPNNPLKKNGNPNGSDFLILMAKDSTVVPPIAPSPGCTYTPPKVGILEKTYEGELDVLPNTGGYHIVYENTARQVANVLNINVNLNPVPGMSFYTFIPPSNITNSSPYFSKVPVAFTCVNKTINFYNDAIDDDGDSLVYEFANPYREEDQFGQPGNPPPVDYKFPIPNVTYNGGYSFTDVFGTFGTSILDPKTGTAQYQCGAIGVFVIVVEVSEYRRGVGLLSKVRRDMEMIVDGSCGANVSPEIDSTATGNGKVIYIDEGATVHLPINFKDPELDSVMVSFSGDPLNPSIVSPGPTITGKAKGKPSVQDTLHWSTVCGQGRTDPYIITATVQDKACPSFPSPINIKIFVRKPAPTLNGASFGCTDVKNNAYTISDGQTNSKYLWTITGGTPATGTGSSQVIDWGVPDPSAQIKVVETNQWGCKSAAVVKSVPVKPLPVATITPKTATLCINNSDSLFAPNDPSLTSFNWFGGGINFTTPKIGVNPTVNTTYFLVVKDQFCTSDTGSYNLVVNGLPTAGISSTPSSVCPHTNVTVKATGGDTYSWKRGGSTKTYGAGGTIVDTVSLNTTFFVTVTDANTCTAATSTAIGVLQNNALTVFPGKLDTICNLSSISLTASGNNIKKYAWIDKYSPVDTFSFTNTYTYNSANPKTLVQNGHERWIYLMGIDNNNCVARDTIKIEIHLLPTVTYTFSGGVCTGDSLKLTGIVAGDPSGTFVWNSVLGTVTGKNYLIPHLNSPTTFYLKGTDYNQCSSTDTLFFSPKFLPPVSITSTAPNDSACLGNIVYLHALGASGYKWYDFQNATVVLDSANVIADTALADRTYILKGKDDAGCAATVTKTIYVRPVFNVTLSGKSPICPSDKDSIVAKGGKTFLWEAGPGSQNYVSSDSIAKVAPLVTTTYSVTATDVNACTAKNTFVLKVNPKPPLRRLSGTSYVCPSLQNVMYKVTDTIPGLPSAQSAYVWSIVGNAAPNPLQGLNTDSLKVDFSSIAGTVIIKSVEINGFGCLGDTMAIAAQIRSIFAPPVPVGKTVLCSVEDTGIFYMKPIPTIGSVYSWQINGGQIISGNSTPKVLVKWDGVGTGKLWYVETSQTATDNCFGQSDTLNVAINPTPVTSVIKGDSSVCPGATEIYSVVNSGISKYQWSVTKGDSISLGNSTNKVYVDWKKQGIDTIRVVETNAYGCSGAEVKKIVKINAAPGKPAILGGVFVCPTNADNKLYKVTNPVAGSQYQWTITNGTGNKNGLDSIFVQWLPGESNYVIQVVEVTKDSCLSAPASLAIQYDKTSSKISAVGTLAGNEKEISIEWPQVEINNQLVPYTLYKRQPATQWQLISANLFSNTFTDKDVMPDAGLYLYKVAFKNACGDSTISAVHNSMFLKGSKDESEQNIYLSWNAYHNWDKGVRDYLIYRKTADEDVYSFYKTANDTIISISDTRLSSRYCYRIMAEEKGGNNVSWSNDTCIDMAHFISIPSAFTPNGDGTNDTWVIKNIEAYPNASVNVFNRWGTKVLSVSGYKNNWDGAQDGKDLPEGTYYYVIKLNAISENTAFKKSDEYTGSVTILR